MSYPILYSQTETDFDHNGCGILSDCISCLVSETKNGEYELTMEYPVTGIHFDEIESRSIIKARANQFSEPQLFRVYSQKKSMKRNVVIKAEHISYDLTGIAISPFFASSSLDAFMSIKEKSAIDNSFLFNSDFSVEGEFTSKTPTSARSVLGELLKKYGGVYEFDNFNVRYLSQRGTNRGVSIRYGKNLTDLKQEENCSAIFTGIYPYWISSDESGTLVELPEKIIHAEGNYSFHRIKSVDFSGSFQNQPTQDKLREAAVKYMEQNHVGVPQVSLTVSFVSLEQSAEYRNSGILEKVSIGDTVNVEFPAMGVSADAEAVKVVYNVLLDRVDSVTLGNVKNNIADTIAEQKKELLEVPKKSQLQIAIDVLTKALLGATGGSVRMLDTNEDGMPDTLYIADDPDPSKAKKVWRFNYEGWGASKTGYDGPYTIGASFDSGILAEFVTAGTLYGMLLKAGAIESENGDIRIDLTTNSRATFNSGISTNGLFVRNKEDESKNIIELHHIYDSVGSENFSATELRMGSGNDDKHDVFHVREESQGDTYMTLQSGYWGNGNSTITIPVTTTSGGITMESAKKSIEAELTFLDGGNRSEEVIDTHATLKLKNNISGALFKVDVNEMFESPVISGLLVDGEKIGVGMQVEWELNEKGTYSMIGRKAI